MLQRDGFIEEISWSLETNNNIFFLSADFGAAALDILRVRYKDNFIHCGISEQNMIDVAVGLALEGKNVFCYAMAPFITLRALEQIKTGPGIMNLPICLISVGIGIGYADSGPTHYATEDFACLRSIIGVNIYTSADTSTARRLAKDLLANPKFAYVRLDRHNLPEVENVKDHGAFRVICGKHFGMPPITKIALISHGKTLHTCAEVVRRVPDRFFAIDLVQSKPFPKALVELLYGTEKIVVVDEQTLAGSLGAAVFEAFSDVRLFPKIINVTLSEKYFFENIGRDGIFQISGLTPENIIKQAERF